MSVFPIVEELWKFYLKPRLSFEISSVQLLSHFQLFATPWTATSLSITNSQSLPKLMSIESVIPSNHFILCCPLLLLSSIFLSIRVFSNELVLHIGGQSIAVSVSTSFSSFIIRDLIIPLWCESVGSASHGGKLLHLICDF